jgi:hypothetical protein
MGDSGSSLVEAVLVVPVLMLILFAVIQFVLWAHAAQVAQLAASEGDRTARSFGGGGAAAGIARARSVLQGPGSDLATSSAAIDMLAGDRMRIVVTGRAISIFPGVSLPVSATLVGPVQEFRVSG